MQDIVCLQWRIDDPIVETSVKVNEVLCGDNEINLLIELQMKFLLKKLEKIMWML